MTDPRLGIIESRFRNVGRIIAVSSGKGGVGKSMIATSLALSLRNIGKTVGLLDLDFTSPSTHFILGVSDLYPEEERGIIPPIAHGLRFMSITFYSLDKPAPLRGLDVSNSIIELLAITRWEGLDYLVVDMPPGIGDATLDTIRFMPSLEFLVVSTPSRMAFQSVRRLILLLQNLKVPMLGVLENMVMSPSNYIEEEAKKISVPYLGCIRFDRELEASIGTPDKLQKTAFFKEIEGIRNLIL